MCWVMPPASPAATSVSRMASSSEVLPWSTCPMIVTTGGRSTSSSSASSNTGSASTSSAAWTISISFLNSSARTWMASSVSVWVRVAISPRPISFLITSGTGTPKYSATSLTVEPELMRMRSTASWALVSRGAIVSSYVPRRRRPPRRGGRRWGAGGPLGCRREACESITTRRRPPGPIPPGMRSPVRESRVGRWRGVDSPAASRVGRCRGAGSAAGVPPSPGGAPDSEAAEGSAASAGAPLGAAPLPLSASSAALSSTLEAAALTSRPAARRRSSNSLLEMPCSLAISWTRRLAIRRSILGSRVAASPRGESPGPARHRGRLSPGRAPPSTRRRRGRDAGPPDRAPPGHRPGPDAGARPWALIARIRRTGAAARARLWPMLLSHRGRRRGRLLGLVLGGAGGLRRLGRGFQVPRGGRRLVLLPRRGLPGGLGGGVLAVGVRAWRGGLDAGASGLLGACAAVGGARHGGHLVRGHVLERLVGLEPAVARAGKRGVGAAPAVGENGRAAALDLFLLVAVLGLLGGELGLGLDVHPPAGQARGEPCVLAFAPDGQRQLVVGDDHRRLFGVVVHQHLAHPGRRERLGHEAGGLVVVGDDVDLLAAQLADHHAHP